MMQPPEHYVGRAEDWLYTAEKRYHGNAQQTAASFANAYATLALVAIKLRNGE